MAKNRSHGTPEQFEQAVRQRIEELTGDIESATRVDASYIPEKIPGLIIQTVDEAYEADGGDDLYDSIDEYAENYYEMPASKIKKLYGLYDGSNEDTGIETTDSKYYIAYSGHGVVQMTRDEMLHHFARDVGLDDDVESNTAIMADTDRSGLFADPNGIIGEPGELYTYEELKQMYESGVDSDQWLASYPTFDAWYQQIILGYLDRVSGEAGPADDDEDTWPWEFLGVKQVKDTDGFWTDYTLWVNHETGVYVCIFGDSDLYTPENSDPDFETESEFEAYEWFNDYDTGELEGEDNIYDEEVSDVNSASNASITAAYDGDEMDMKQFLKWLSDRGIDVSKHNYELKAESYDTGRPYTYRFKAPGDWIAYMSMRLHRRMTRDNIMEYINDEWLYDENYDELFDSVSNMRKLAESRWWGDGDDFIHYLKNLDTGEMLYEFPENNEPEYQPDQDWDDEGSNVNSATNTCGVAAKPVVGAEVLYVDDGGVLGEPGAQYTYDELEEIYLDNHEDDPVMEEYDSFDYWFKDTKPYLRVIKSSSQIKADLSEVPDVTEVVIESSEDDSWEDVPSDVSSTDIRSDVYSELSNIAFQYSLKGIELTQADFQDAFDFFMLKFFDSDSNE